MSDLHTKVGILHHKSEQTDDRVTKLEARIRGLIIHAGLALIACDFLWDMFARILQIRHNYDFGMLQVVVLVFGLMIFIWGMRWK